MIEPQSCPLAARFLKETKSLATAGGEVA